MTSRIETKEPAATAGAATPRPWRYPTGGAIVTEDRVHVVADWTGKTADGYLAVEAVNDYDRLRRIEAAARTYIEAERRWLKAGVPAGLGTEADAAAAALRAALTSSTPEKP